MAQVARDFAGRAVVLKVDRVAVPRTGIPVQRPGDTELRGIRSGNLQFQQAGLVDANTMKSWLATAA